MQKSDFWKGVKFHCFVDENRDTFYENNGVYIPKVSDAIFIYSLKVLEDDILYSELSYRQDFVKFSLRIWNSSRWYKQRIYWKMEKCSLQLFFPTTIHPIKKRFYFMNWINWGLTQPNW